ncbi:MAG: hypothetical protein AB8G22_14570 [Saprospiraceae bacterium]
MTDRENENRSRILMGILIALALLFGIGSCYFWNSSRQLGSQNLALKAEVEDLNQLKGSLETDIDSLQAAYATVVSENGELKGNLEEAEKRLAERESQLRRLRRSYKTVQAEADDSASLRSQLEGLINAKSALEADISNLRTENQRLQEENAALASQVESANQKNTQLSGQVQDLDAKNKAIRDRLDKLAPAGFRASAFRVEVEKRNNKLTSKARAAKEVSVSFDLINVPEDKQGLHKLYVAVTNFQGTPVKTTSSQSVTISNATETVTIDALTTKETNLNESQRLKLSFTPDQRLSPGYYNVFIYSDLGYLGSTSLRLR